MESNTPNLFFNIISNYYILIFKEKVPMEDPKQHFF